jgi:hypothetical protein
MAFLHGVLKTDCNKNISISVWLIIMHMRAYIYSYQCKIERTLNQLRKSAPRKAASDGAVE